MDFSSLVPDFIIVFEARPQSGRIGGGNNNQSGKAKIDILPALLLFGMVLLLMSFFENAGAEIIGGIVGGLVVLLAASLWYKWRNFQLSFLDPREKLRAEHTRGYSALRTEAGRCCFVIRLTPRLGVDLIKCSLAFFDKGRLPMLVGRRCSINDAKIYELRWFDSRQQKFKDHNYVTFRDNEGSYVDLPGESLPSGSCTYYEVYAEISETLKSWEGILSFQIHYQRNGNPEKGNVRTKIFVRANNQRRPFRSMFKKVLIAKKIE